MSAAKSKKKSNIWTIEESQIRSRLDDIATEEPLEIRLVSPAQTLAVTMRTPGADFDLVTGFLYSEGVITSREDISKMSYCVDPDIDGEQRQNIINVALKSGLTFDFKRLERHFFMTSACGVCGKASIESLKFRELPQISSDFNVNTEIIYRLNDQLKLAQGLFSATGGLHAAALFNSQGKLLKLREDVGRHNALDKLIGSSLLTDDLPLAHHIVMVSGRSSFEILQKCIVAGVPILCAVSAPSSLAVEIAQAFNITLIGFLRGRRFNIYSGIERIKLAS
ncbi:formate dehydrogenase accessory sulfurtransferase FdhD [Lyngbya sp. PCC 8106]|uniref:formate dehydrogenase accessory sulfurtransferase FdhD n=1 Tax=Lyngbya sp. (strain PCC 8106) TaxID=313612 RepID=UPI0000EAAC7A|nr:formate dehydrogenase accessory sulfurtransferase FdhD [Lyngbya sp. PCC 8106]EAW37142.1 formate dehydrogenase accessory protein [Lyngbya sp. PCC 8106]